MSEWEQEESYFSALGPKLIPAGAGHGKAVLSARSGQDEGDFGARDPLDPLDTGAETLPHRAGIEPDPPA